MSLCYDFQKWTMISLASVAVRLATGLVTMAHGTTCCPILGSIDDLERDALLNDLTNGRFNEMKTIITYCYDHLNSATNPVQDLINNGTVPSYWNGKDCLTVKQEYENLLFGENWNIK
jgi:hypothetical protein